MLGELLFLPQPRIITFIDGLCTLTDFSQILTDPTNLQPQSLTTDQVQNSFEKFFHIRLKNITEDNSSESGPKIILRIDPQAVSHSQGYHLSLKPDVILIEANDEPGLFYGVYSFIQIISQSAATGTAPCLRIQDWPDFQNRGVMLDISRDKVPTMETIFDLVYLLASWKINQLQLYTEHTFAYQQHPEVWADASPFNAAEIRELDAFCRSRFIELVPNQNSFGHMERWLKHPHYQHLAEIPPSLQYTWGRNEGPSCLCPLDPASLQLMSSLYDELLPNFSSRQINIGCDETFDVGKGRSRDKCERIGVGRVYFNYLLKIYENISRRGYQMQFWADMVLSHPELIRELPQSVIALVWGYEADYRFDQHAEQFAMAGLPFYVCPGTSSWNSIAGRTDNCLENLKNAAKNGLKFGSKGYLNTDWGDNGHWQVLPISYLGFAAGAAYSWSYIENETLDIQAALNRFAFCDSTNALGKIAYGLGNLYKDAGLKTDNSSYPFEIIQNPAHAWANRFSDEKAVTLFTSNLDRLNQAESTIHTASPDRPDKHLLVREFLLTISLLKHASLRGLQAYLPDKYRKADLYANLDQIIDEYKSIWLLRNRPGGLQDSLAYFETAKKEYR